MRYKIPDFFIAGAPKCGTTSMYRWLEAHPKTYMPVKEPGFFSQDIRAIPHSDIRHYESLFSKAEGTELLVGEASPKYLYSQEGLARIKEYNPNAKIIVMLRNPVDLIISLHGQMLREGIETEVDFNIAWGLSRDRQLGKHVPESCKWPMLLNYELWGSIGSALSRLLCIFPKEQVRVMLLDDIESRPKVVYQETLRFLGLADDGRQYFEALNKRAAIRSLFVHRIILNARRFLDPVVIRLLGDEKRQGTGIIKFVNRFNQIPNTYQSTIEPEFRANLIRHFSSDISQIKNITGRDLSAWE